jgi:hypothetical protein
MIRLFLAAATMALVCGSASAQLPDVNCAIAKTFRCTVEGCAPVALEAGIRFNLGSKQACLTRGDQCSGGMEVESSERIGDEVIVRFKGTGMVLRVNAQSGAMVGGDASQNSTVFAYGGTCK